MALARPPKRAVPVVETVARLASVPAPPRSLEGPPSARLPPHSGSSRSIGRCPRRVAEFHRSVQRFRARSPFQLHNPCTNSDSLSSTISRGGRRSGTMSEIEQGCTSWDARPLDRRWRRTGTCHDGSSRKVVRFCWVGRGYWCGPRPAPCVSPQGPRPAGRAGQASPIATDRTPAPFFGHEHVEFNRARQFREPAARFLVPQILEEGQKVRGQRACVLCPFQQADRRRQREPQCSALLALLSF